MNAWDRQKTSSYSRFRSCKDVYGFQSRFQPNSCPSHFQSLTPFGHRKWFQIQGKELVESSLLSIANWAARIVKLNEMFLVIVGGQVIDFKSVLGNFLPKISSFKFTKIVQWRKMCSRHFPGKRLKLEGGREVKEETEMTDNDVNYPARCTTTTGRSAFSKKGHKMTNCLKAKLVNCERNWCGTSRKLGGGFLLRFMNFMVQLSSALAS